jgi:hypothetical protein
MAMLLFYFVLAIVVFVAMRRGIDMKSEKALGIAAAITVALIGGYLAFR